MEPDSQNVFRMPPPDKNRAGVDALHDNNRARALAADGRNKQQTYTDRGPRKPPDPGTGQAVVESFSFHDRIYELRRNSCGKSNCTVCEGTRPAHGPYWYMCVSLKGRWRRVYLGKDLDTSKFVDADGNLHLPPRRALLRPFQPPADIQDDQPGQTRLFSDGDVRRQLLWTCQGCKHQVLEGNADHLMLLRSARCPACRSAADVSLLPPCHGS